MHEPYMSAVTKYSDLKVQQAHSLREATVREGMIDIAMQIMRWGKWMAVDV